jgi:hypothetical protein
LGEAAHGVNRLTLTENSQKLGLTSHAQRLCFGTMKKLLSLLLCYVFLQAESFALRGGPANSGTLTVNGYYSGTLTDTSGQGNTGLFLIAAASNGASDGEFIIFSFSTVSSNSFSGTMTGLSDTSKGGTGKFIGVFSGTSVVSSSAATQSISGEITCTAVKSTYQTLRLTGTATSETLTVDTSIAANTGTTNVNGSSNFSGTTVGAPVTYTVDGWQTSAPSSSSTGLSL